MFGFDPKTLSDDELLDRITDLGRRVMYAAKFTRGDIVYQLQQQKLMCEAEQRERAFSHVMDARRASVGVVVESDPDLAAAAAAAKEAETIKNAPKTTTRRPKPFNITERMRPTARPSTDKDT